MSNPVTFNIVGSTIAQSATVSVKSIGLIQAGMNAFGIGIPLGATVLAVNTTASTVTISSAATATTTNAQLFFTTAMNILLPWGAVTASQSQLLSFFETGFQTAYNDPTINLDSDTPDGQAIGLFIQVILDVLDFFLQILASFDRNQAVGVQLDARNAFSGVTREGGAYSQTPITIVTTQSCTLQGLDLFPDDPYTIADNNGNQWQLLSTQYPSGAGTSSGLLFQAVNPGAILTTPNTITTPVTFVLGVASVNNPNAQTQIGEDEELDAAYRIRGQQSVSMGSQGFVPAMEAALANVSGVIAAKVYENATAATSTGTVPANVPSGIGPNSIWVIVNAPSQTNSVMNAAIANAIYVKRSTGCGMRGSQPWTITQPDGSPFLIYWDWATPQSLWVAFSVSIVDPTVSAAPNVLAIASGLAGLITPGVNQKVNLSQLGTAVQELDPNSYAWTSSSGVFCATSGGTYANVLAPPSANEQFVIGLANPTCTGTSGSAVLSVTTTTGIIAGMFVYGNTSALPTGSVTVESVDASANTVTISGNLTAAMTGTELYFTTVGITVV